MKKLLLITVCLALVAITSVTCAPTAPPSAPAPSIPSAQSISWDKASQYIGERVTVCGPVAGTKYASTSKGKPTFLNIGRAYPDPGRFTVVIWGNYRSNFSSPPEIYYADKTICVYGLVTEYEGIPQIEVKTPDQIQEQ